MTSGRLLLVLVAVGVAVSGCQATEVPVQGVGSTHWYRDCGTPLLTEACVSVDAAGVYRLHDGRRPVTVVQVVETLHGSDGTRYLVDCGGECPSMTED